MTSNFLREEAGSPATATAVRERLPNRLLFGEEEEAVLFESLYCPSQ
jgi:hypothetical protein